MKKILLVLAFILVTRICSEATECKRYDFARPEGGIPNLAVGVAFMTWTGGGEQQCRQVRDQVAVAYRQRLADAEAMEQRAKERLRAARTGSDESMKALKADLEAIEQTSKAQRLYSSLGACQCVAWGESDFERQMRERREAEQAQRAQEAEEA